jgi:hypothetical protein
VLMDDSYALTKYLVDILGSLFAYV